MLLAVAVEVTEVVAAADSIETITTTNNLTG
jgi:hypothetical protein